MLFRCLSVSPQGVAAMEGRASGRMGVLTLLYIFLTTLLGVVIGLVLAVAIRPGKGFNSRPPEDAILPETSYTDIFADLLR